MTKSIAKPKFDAKSHVKSGLTYAAIVLVCLSILGGVSPLAPLYELTRQYRTDRELTVSRSHDAICRRVLQDLERRGLTVRGSVPGIWSLTEAGAARAKELLATE